MPPRKQRSKNKKEIQKINIKARLIEISMKVDDFVYKKIPIPAEAAKLYAQEIASYKVQCTGDPRSLQVIEKLTLFMKKIVDDNYLNNSNNDLQQVPSAPDSNNYKAVAATSRNEILILKQTTYHHIASQTSPDAIKTPSKPTEDDDEIMTNNAMGVIDDIDLERTLSNLSLNCFIDPLPNNTTDQLDEIMKSLVTTKYNDTENSNKNSNKVTSTASKPTVSFDKYDSIPIETNTDIHIDSNVLVLDKSSVAIKPFPNNLIAPSLDISHKIVRNLEKLDYDQQIDGHCAQLNQATNYKSIPSTKTNPESTNNSAQENINIVCAENSAIPRNNTITVSFQETEISITNKSRKKKNDDANPVNETLKRLKTPRNKIGKENNLKAKEIKPKKSAKTKPKLKASLFNNLDLSWVEDIKYVREINPEEFDTINKFDDSFWNNLSFPLNWDENSFN